MRHIIENEYLKVEVSELGATLVRFIEKRDNTDIVLGYETDEEYRKYPGNLGASIGRNANRIKDAKFVLNGVTYELNKNNYGNNIHGGGINGFGFRMWKTEFKNESEVRFSYFSKDGEEGFPGDLKAEVTYKLEGKTLLFSYSGTAYADTLFNMTNHAYFNLGDEDILNEYLRVTADRYAPTDEYGLTLDEVCTVEGTPYDFTEFRRIDDNLSRLEKGIDNNYVWEVMGDKLMAQLKNERYLFSVYSDLPDMHLYTGNMLAEQTGKYGVKYTKHKGLCLECQFFPNGINYGDKYLSAVLRKGESTTHYMRYEFDYLNS